MDYNTPTHKTFDEVANSFLNPDQLYEGRFGSLESRIAAFEQLINPSELAKHLLVKVAESLLRYGPKLPIGINCHIPMDILNDAELNSYFRGLIEHELLGANWSIISMSVASKETVRLTLLLEENWG